jgi:hypothetical protein
MKRSKTWNRSIFNGKKVRKYLILQVALAIVLFLQTNMYTSLDLLNKVKTHSLVSFVINSIPREHMHSYYSPNIESTKDICQFRPIGNHRLWRKCIFLRRKGLFLLWWREWQAWEINWVFCIGLSYFNVINVVIQYQGLKLLQFFINAFYCWRHHLLVIVSKFN